MVYKPKRAALLADPSGGMWDLSQRMVQYLDERYPREGYELWGLDLTRYVEDEFLPEIPKHVRDRSVYFIADTSLRPAESIIQTQLVNAALKGSKAPYVVDMLPYLFFSRQDRKDRGRVPISAKVIAENLERHSDHQICFDLHADQIVGFFERYPDNVYMFPFASRWIKKYHPDAIEAVWVQSPDVGGGNRNEIAAETIDALGLQISFKSRRENPNDPQVTVFGDYDGANVLMTDDILASGTTIINATQAARNAGAGKVSAFLTHPFFLYGYPEGTTIHDAHPEKTHLQAITHVSDALDTVFISETIPLRVPREQLPDNVVQVPSHSFFGEVIHRDHDSGSVSELFTDRQTLDEIVERT